MLIRCLLLASLATGVTFDVCDNLVVGNAAVPDRASQRYIESLIGPVKARFAAVAGASRCRQEDNRYSYNRLVSKLSGAGQAILERAASDGVEEGRSVATAGAPDETDSCRAAIERLRAADDRLLILSERLSG